MLYVITVNGFVITIQLWRILREVRKNPYLQASYNHGKKKERLLPDLSFLVTE